MIESRLKDYAPFNAPLPEIAGFFKCSHDTIERWCKKEYGINYGDVHQMYRQDGLVSLRRIQFKQGRESSDYGYLAW